MYMSCVLYDGSTISPTQNWRDGRGCVPSPINPTNNVATESKRIGGITQPTLRTFEHGALIHEVVEHLATLGEKVVQPRLGAL
jgi:hypothetical protein